MPELTTPAAGVASPTFNTFRTIQRTLSRYIHSDKVLHARPYLVMDGGQDGSGTDNTAGLQAIATEILTGAYTAIVWPKGCFVSRTSWQLLLPHQHKLLVWDGYGCEHIYDNPAGSPGTPIVINAQNATAGNWFQRLEIMGFSSRISGAARRIGGLDQISVNGFKEFVARGITIRIAENCALTTHRSAPGANDTERRQWVPWLTDVQECHLGGGVPESGALHTYGSIGDSGFWNHNPALVNIFSNNTVEGTGDDAYMIGHTSVEVNTDGQRRSWIAQGNIVMNCNSGFKCLAPNGTVKGNRFTNVSMPSIWCKVDDVVQNGVGGDYVDILDNVIERVGMLTAADLKASSILNTGGNAPSAAVSLQGDNIKFKGNTIDHVVPGTAVRLENPANGKTSCSNLEMEGNTYRRINYDAAGARKAQATGAAILGRSQGSSGRPWSDVRMRNETVIDTAACLVAWQTGECATDANLSLDEIYLYNVDHSGATIAALYISAGTAGKLSNVRAGSVDRPGLFYRDQCSIGRLLRATGGALDADLFDLHGEDATGYRFGTNRGAVLIGNQLRGVKRLPLGYAQASASGTIVREIDAPSNIKYTIRCTTDSATSGARNLIGEWEVNPNGNVITPIRGIKADGAAWDTVAGYYLTCTRNGANANMPSGAAWEIKALHATSWVGTMDVYTEVIAQKVAQIATAGVT